MTNSSKLHMLALIALVFVLNIKACKGVVDIPGCGDLEDIRWNSTCLHSSMHRLTSTLHEVLAVNNVLMYDGKLYVIVPPKKEEKLKESLRYKLERFANKEIEFQVVNISESPLTFGQARHDNQYRIKKVLQFDNAIIMQSRNLKTKILEQVAYESIAFAPTGEIQRLLCNFFSVCSINDDMRNSTLLISIQEKHRQMDWDNGVNLFCFSRLGQFPLVLSSALNDTLYMLRQAIMYLPHSEQNFIPPQLQKSIRNKCIKQGYAYDASCKVWEAKPYEVSICSMFRNEGKYILEWVAYHNTIGIQHFYLYDDGSTDDSLQILQPMIQQSIVTVINRSDIALDDYFGWAGQAVKHCSDNFGKTSRWMVVIDMDEFVVVKGDKYNNNISTWIQDHYEVLKDTGSVEVPLVHFAGNYPQIINTQLITAEIFYKYPPDPRGKSIKYMANTNGLQQLYIHYPYTFLPLRDGKLSDSCKLLDHFNSNCTNTDSLEVFHYVAKSYEQCANKTKPNLWRPSWRSRSGLKYCNEMVYGKDYEPDFWQLDRFLANEKTTLQICKKMKELNKEVYEKKDLCASYELHKS